MIVFWKPNDVKTLNRFIQRGNTLKIDFTETEFKNLRSEVMFWLSSVCKDKGELELSDTYLIKTCDIINTDSDLAHVENNMDENDRHSYRQKQLAGILAILNDYKTQNTISWSNIRSWVSIFIALLSLILHFM